MMCPWSNNSMTCHVCKTNYNRKMESIKGKPEELKWFKGVMNNRDGRTKWFERTKTTYEPCKRSAFDTAGAYEEASGSRTFDRDFAMYKWLPVDEWIIRQRLLGECGDGTAKEQAQVARDDFKTKVSDLKFPTKSINGVFLLGVYTGEINEVGKEDSTRKESKRIKVIEDTVSLDAAAEAGDEFSKSQAAWLKDRTEVASSGITRGGGNETDISPLEARVSQHLKPLDDKIDRMIAKDISNNMVRHRKIAMQDEIDEHEMKESLKIGAEAAAVHKGLGRPKLGGTEVLES